MGCTEVSDEASGHGISPLQGGMALTTVVALELPFPLDLWL